MSDDHLVNNDVICAYCGETIEYGTTCVFMFGNFYHTGCNKHAILGDQS